MKALHQHLEVTPAMGLSVLKVLLQGQISFQDFERKLLQAAIDLVGEVLQQVLEELDDEIFENRDREQFQVLQKASKQLDTLVGTVTVKRRLYRDTLTGKNVYLLDELLGLEPRTRVSPGLVETLAKLGLYGPSYREAARQLQDILGKRLVSHETIRQKVNQAGEKLAHQQEVEATTGNGRRRPGVLYLEVDGLFVHLQREKRSGTEVQVVTAHEGWARRHPASNEYKLVNAQHFTVQGSYEECWEQVFWYLSARYSLKDTMVVINGDRAPWIQRGVEWFPRAMYQLDRFHLKREVDALLRNQKDRAEEAEKALAQSDSGRFFCVLAEALEQETNSRRRRELEKLVNALVPLEQSLRDYRVRLAEMGYEISGYRGMGSAESQVDRYANRVKKRGQSWRQEGLKAVMTGLSALFDGRFSRGIRVPDSEEIASSQQELRDAIGSVKERLVEDMEEVWRASIPSRGRGRNSSKGFSRFFGQLINAPLRI